MALDSWRLGGATRGPDHVGATTGGFERARELSLVNVCRTLRNVNMRAVVCNGMEHLISTGRAAELLGISRQAVWRLVGRGRLPSRWVCGRLLLDRRQVLDLGADADYQRKSRRRDA